MPRAHVIFDFDLTLFPAESTRELARMSVRRHRNHAAVLEFLDGRGDSARFSARALLHLLNILWSIDRSSVDECLAASRSALDPAFFDLIDFLKRRDIGVHVISSGYAELVAGLAGSLGFEAANVAANRFVWWRRSVVGVVPGALHGERGKVRIVRRWRASGKLQGPVVMVGDGRADRHVFQAGLADGFIQADYYRASGQPLMQGNYRVARDPRQLKPQLCELLGLEADLPGACEVCVSTHAPIPPAAYCAPDTCAMKVGPVSPSRQPG